MRALMGTRDSHTMVIAVTHPLDPEVGDFPMDMAELVAEVSQTVVVAVGIMALPEVVDTMALPEEEVDSRQEDTVVAVVAHQAGIEVVAVDSRLEDQEDLEDQGVEAQPQEEVSQLDPVEADTVVEDSRLVDLAAVVEAVAVAHRPLLEGHTPYLPLARMTIRLIANQTSRHTRTTSRLKIGRTGSGVYATYCMPKEWNKC